MELEDGHRYLVEDKRYHSEGDDEPSSFLRDFAVMAKTPDGEYALLKDMSIEADNDRFPFPDVQWVSTSSIIAKYEVDLTTGLNPR